MRFGLSISASTATKVGRISPVAARAGECPFTQTDSGCSAGEAKLVFLPHLRHSPVARPYQVCGNQAFRRFPRELFRLRAQMQ
jgi:hypothetical protein